MLIFLILCAFLPGILSLKSVIFLLWNLEAISSNFPAIQYAVNDDVTIVTDAPGSQETSLVHVAHVSGKYPW